LLRRDVVASLMAAAKTTFDASFPEK